MPASIKGADGKPIIVGGKPLVVALTTAAVEKIKATTGWDVMEVGAGRFDKFLAVVDDRAQLLAVLQIVTEATPEQLSEFLRGDAFDLVTEALVEELASFFPSSRRKRLLALWKAFGELEAESVPVAMAKFKETVGPILIEKVGEAMEAATSPPATSGVSSTAPPPYSESIPAPTPGGS